MNTCKTCRHWKIEEDQSLYSIIRPIDPDTFEPMVMPFEVRQCKSPRLIFHERPIEATQATIADGSEYWAGLFPAEDFGCVNHEAVDPPRATVPETVKLAASYWLYRES